MYLLVSKKNSVSSLTSSPSLIMLMYMYTMRLGVFLLLSAHCVLLSEGHTEVSFPPNVSDSNCLHGLCNNNKTNYNTTLHFWLLYSVTITRPHVGLYSMAYSPSSDGETDEGGGGDRGIGDHMVSHGGRADREKSASAGDGGGGEGGEGNSNFGVDSKKTFSMTISVCDLISLRNKIYPPRPPSPSRIFLPPPPFVLHLTFP